MEKKVRIYSFKCPYCGKVITSTFSRDQVVFLALEHLLKHRVTMRFEEVQVEEREVKE
ncbi:MAG: hypothetical protein QXP84_08100 [Candidatus Korarchaeum sp.]